MNIRRMEKLAAHLDTVPPRGFFMMAWITGYCRSDNDKTKVAQLKEAHKNEYKCGMAACVGGHAAIVFPNLLAYEHGCIVHAQHSELEGSEAIGRVLGLCIDHAMQLTAAGARHQTPKAAAKFIRSLIEKNPPCCGRKVAARV